MKRRLIVLLVLTALVSSVFVGSAFAQEEMESDIPVHTIAITEEGIEVPEGIEPGVATLVFDNSAQEEGFAFAVLFQLNEGATVEDFFAFMMASMSGEDPGDPIGVARGGSFLEPGGTFEATFILEPGQYIFLDAGRAEPAVAQYDVAGEMPEDVVPPEADVELELIDYAFNMPAEVEAGEVVMGLTNAGEEDHEIVMMRILDDELSEEEIMEMAMSGEGGEDGIEQVLGFIGLGSGAQAWVTVDLVPGRYLLICNVPAADDGQPHLSKGMIRLITVVA